MSDTKYTQLGIEETLDSIQNQLDQVRISIGSIDKTMIENTASLVEHVKRTDMLEQQLELLKSDLRPVEKHVAQMEGILKFVGLVSLIITAIIGILQIKDFFK